jgi:hypothetical protein
VAFEVNTSVAAIHEPRDSSSWSCRAAAWGAWEAKLAVTRETVHIAMGAQSQAGKREPVARQQSLQWSRTMKGRGTGVPSAGDKGCNGRSSNGGMDTR